MQESSSEDFQELFSSSLKKIKRGEPVLKKCLPVISEDSSIGYDVIIIKIHKLLGLLIKF
jgi:hypothetical protein